MEALRWVPAALVWAALLFAQHVVCFDVFDTNLWYLYLLAVAFAACQYILLHRNRPHRALLCTCGVAYSTVGVLKTPVTLILIFQGGWGLSLLCQLLDLAGAAYCFRLAGIIRKKVIL